MSHTLEDGKCDYCGKNFIPAPYHIYKVEDGKGRFIFCCYTCKLHYMEQIEAQKRKRKEQRQKRTEEKRKRNRGQK